MSYYQSQLNLTSGSFSSLALPDGAVAGYFLTSADNNGTFQWSDLSSVAVRSVAGTANRVLSNGTYGTPQTGSIILTLPDEVTINKIYLANGTSALPSISFSNFTNCGLFAQSASKISLAVAGSSIIDFNSASIDLNATENSQNILPKATTSYQLGSSSKRFTQLWANELNGYIGGSFGSQTNITQIGTQTAGLIMDSAITTIANNAYDIGDNTYKFKNIYAYGYYGQVLDSSQNSITAIPNLITVGTIFNGTWGASTIQPAYGGTGQTTYTNGQLLIGNSSGNTLTKATLTGTANQVVITNGAGSITLSLPQSIATSSSLTFANVTSNLTGNVTGNVTGNLTGTILTASQPNITSLGTLTSLTLGGTLALGSSSITGSGSNTIQGLLSTASQPNITTLAALTSAGSTSGTLNTSGVVNLSDHNGINKGLSLAGTLVTATAQSLNFNANMIPGTAIASKTLATDSSNNLSGINSLSATTLAGTLSTASQPNITSLGTLTSLTIQTNLTTSGTNYNLLNLYGGSLTSNTYLQMRRLSSTDDLVIAVAGMAGNWGASAAVGDVVIRNSNSGSIHLVSGSGISQLAVKNAEVTFNTTLNANSNNITNVVDLTSSGTINANAIQLTNQSGTVTTPNISCYSLANSGLYYHKTNQKVGVTLAGSRVIEGDAKNSKCYLDLNAEFTGSVKIIGGDLNMNNNGISACSLLTTTQVSSTYCIVGTGGYITLPTSGGTASQLNYYESGSFSLTTSSAFVSTITIYFTRVGKQVNLLFPNDVLNRNCTANNLIITAAQIPSRLYPPATIFGFIYGADNNAGKTLSYAYQNDGKVLIGTSMVDITAAFTAGTPVICGHYSFSITYTLS